MRRRSDCWTCNIKYSLKSDFIDHLNTIATLSAQDSTFSNKARQDEALDKEIRILELKDAAISGEQIQQ
jgi:hypothetical protein